MSIRAAHRLARSWLLAGAVALLASGCAAPGPAPLPADAGAQLWSGRLALQTDEAQPVSFSAAFELRGRPEAGELTLFTPLGGTAALLRWSPGQATLQAQGQQRQFDSLDALVRDATGAPIPVPALFDWLAGIDTPVAGWTADLSQLAQGRVRAQRHAPPPRADLRVVLDPR